MSEDRKTRWVFVFVDAVAGYLLAQLADEVFKASWAVEIAKLIVWVAALAIAVFLITGNLRMFSGTAKKEQEEQIEPFSIYASVRGVRLDGISKEEAYIDFDLILINASGIRFSVLSFQGAIQIAGNQCHQPYTWEPARLIGGRVSLSIRQPITEALARRLRDSLAQDDGLVVCSLSLTLLLTSETTKQSFVAHPLLQDSFQIRGPIDFDSGKRSTFAFPVTLGHEATYGPDGLRKVKTDQEKRVSIKQTLRYYRDRLGQAYDDDPERQFHLYQEIADFLEDSLEPKEAKSFWSDTGFGANIDEYNRRYLRVVDVLDRIDDLGINPNWPG